MTYAIARPDQGIAAALQQRIDTKTKPLGALGRLEALANITKRQSIIGL